MGRWLMGWLAVQITKGNSTLVTSKANGTQLPRENRPALQIDIKPQVQADDAFFAILAGLTRGLSGGDILNVCVKTIHAGSLAMNPERWVVGDAGNVRAGDQ